MHKQVLNWPSLRLLAQTDQTCCWPASRIKPAARVATSTLRLWTREPSSLQLWTQLYLHEKYFSCCFQAIYAQFDAAGWQCSIPANLSTLPWSTATKTVQTKGGNTSAKTLKRPQRLSSNKCYSLFFVTWGHTSWQINLICNETHCIRKYWACFYW